MFSVLIHKKALKEINESPEEDRVRIRNAIKEMATEPFGGDVKPIKGVRGVLRRRVGDYRIAFAVNFEKARNYHTQGRKKRQVLLMRLNAGRSGKPRSFLAQFRKYGCLDKYRNLDLGLRITSIRVRSFHTRFSCVQDVLYCYNIKRRPAGRNQTSLVRHEAAFSLGQLCFRSGTGVGQGENK